MILVASVSCTARNVESLDAERQFVAEVHATLGDYLDFPPMGRESIRIGGTVPLYFKNKTKDCIVFPYNYGARIFVFQQNSWSELPDITRYPVKHDNVLQAAGSMNDDGFLFVQPDYSAARVANQSAPMRVVIVGNRCINGLASDEKIADYVQFSLQP